MIDTITKMLSPLRTLVRNMVSRALVTSVDDSQKMQVVQLQFCAGEYEEIRTAERVQNYGFSSVPDTDAEAAVVFVGGRRDHGLVIAIDDRRYRVKGLQSGEVCLYDKTGSTVTLKANGDIEVKPHSGTVKFTGDVTVSGTLTATTDVVGGGKHLSSHQHSVVGSNSGGPVVFVPAAETGAPV